MMQPETRAGTFAVGAVSCYCRYPVTGAKERRLSQVVQPALSNQSALT